MSIIYEALQKAEQSGNSGSISEQEKETSSLVRPKKKANFLKGKYFRATFLILLTASIISLLSFNWQRLWDKVFSLSSSAKKEYSLTNRDELAFKTPPPQKAALPQSESRTYLLGGIIYAEDSPVAIINGNAVRKEDLIGDFKVAEITQDSVTLINVNDATELKLSF